jgi:hypothetical protein
MSVVNYGGMNQMLAPKSPVSYDERSVFVNGRRVLLSCGEMHYPRSTRAMWPSLLERSKALGLNTIATYVFWNYHEASRGIFDFSGERDLGHFLDLCHHHGLFVFLRVGPYICAEWNFGGYPSYLRDEPGITIRSMNKPYTDRVEEYFRRIAEVIRPRLASNGGPVVLMQVENEYGNVSKRYGQAGQDYLRWIVQLARRVGLADVPTTTCEGGAEEAIETSNGFTIAPDRIDRVRKSHPGTPILWTELYPSWYRVWGGSSAPARDPRSMAGAILDFVSRGGSGWNYYVWHGGTNFARNSMYLQTTSYDFHAALDEYGCVTNSGSYLGRLHEALQQHSSIILEGLRTESVAGSVRTTIWKKGADELRLIQEDYNESAGKTDQSQQKVPRAKLMNSAGEALFDLDEVYVRVTRSFHESAWTPVSQSGDRPIEWQCWDEPMPAEREDIGVISADPLEQLLLTRDKTDYCWYSHRLQIDEPGQQEIVIPYGGDLFYVFVDDVLVASSKLPLAENRGPITPDDPTNPRIFANKNEVGHERGFEHSFTLPKMTAGAHRLDLLAVALGMIKGDWQIASPMNFERKGIWEGIYLNGKPLRNWTMRPGLVGERLVLESTPGRLAWRRSGSLRPLSWFRTTVGVQANMLDSSTVFRIDAAGLGKGMIWVNGRSIGRHWLIPVAGQADTPSQRFYHVPADWIQPVNEILVLEEQSASPARVQLQVRNADGGIPKWRS